MEKINHFCNELIPDSTFKIDNDKIKKLISEIVDKKQYRMSDNIDLHIDPIINTNTDTIIGYLNRQRNIN